MVPNTEYPLSIGVPMVGVVLLNFALFAGACWASFRVWRAFFALFGPLQPLALAAAAAYLALSFWIYSRPVNALQIHNLHRQRLHPSELARSAKELPALAAGKDKGAGAAAAQ